MGCIKCLRGLITLIVAISLVFSPPLGVYARNISTLAPDTRISEVVLATAAEAVFQKLRNPGVSPNMVDWALLLHAARNYFHTEGLEIYHGQGGVILLHDPLDPNGMLYRFVGLDYVASLDFLSNPSKSFSGSDLIPLGSAGSYITAYQKTPTLIDAIRAEGPLLENVVPPKAIVELAKKYHEGNLHTSPVGMPFRPSRPGDVSLVKDMSSQEQLELIGIALDSLARGEGVIATLAAGSSSRMKVADAPDEVKEMAKAMYGREIELNSKAAVPIGKVGNQVYTFLGAFMHNIARMEEVVMQWAGLKDSPKNKVLILTNDDYAAELDTELGVMGNYGVRSEILKPRQELGYQFSATEKDHQAAHAQLSKKGEALPQGQYEEALKASQEIAQNVRDGIDETIVMPGEKTPLGHGEWFHQMVSSGLLLKFRQEGVKWISVRNIDNSAATFDATWLVTVGLFLKQKRDFQAEVVPRKDDMTGGAWIVREDGRGQLTEDPSFDATWKEYLEEQAGEEYYPVDAAESADYADKILEREGEIALSNYRMDFKGSAMSNAQEIRGAIQGGKVIMFRRQADGASFFVRRVTSSDNHYFNPALGIHNTDYFYYLYRLEGQGEEDFWEEYTNATTEQREAIAQRGRDQFPKITDPKKAKTTPRYVIKPETNMWQSTQIAADNGANVGAIATLGALTISAEEFHRMTPEEQMVVRFLGTKRWDGSESYEGNKAYLDAILAHVDHGELIPSHLMPPGPQAPRGPAGGGTLLGMLVAVLTGALALSPGPGNAATPQGMDSSKAMVLAQLDRRPSAMDILQGRANREHRQVRAPEAQAPAGRNFLEDWAPLDGRETRMTAEKIGDASYAFGGRDGYRGGRIEPSESLSSHRTVTVQARNTSNRSGRFRLEFKQGTTYLLSPFVEMPGDGQWHTYRFEIPPGSRSGKFNYLAVSRASVDFELRDLVFDEDVPEPTTAPTQLPTRAPSAMDILRQAPARSPRQEFPGNLLKGWTLLYPGGDMSFEESHGVFTMSGRGWALGQLEEPVDVSAYEYLNVVAKSKGRSGGSVSLEFKDTSDRVLFGGKKEIEVPGGDAWYVMQLQIPKRERNGTAKLFGFADALGDVFEVQAVYFSNKENSRPQMPLDELQRGALPMDMFEGYLMGNPLMGAMGVGDLFTELRREKKPEDLDAAAQVVLKEIEELVQVEELNGALTTVIEEEVEAGRLGLVDGRMPTPLSLLTRARPSQFGLTDVGQLLLLLTLMGLTLPVAPTRQRARAQQALVLFLGMSAFQGNMYAQVAVSQGAVQAVRLKKKYNLRNPADRQAFIRDVVGRESGYFVPGVGFDPVSGAAYDHANIMLGTWLLGNIGQYGASSKESVHIPQLLGVAIGAPGFEEVGMSSQDARTHLRTKLRSLKRYIEKNPGSHGLMTWVEIKNGEMIPNVDWVPTLDPGEMIWGLPAVVMAFEGSRDSVDRELVELAQWIMDHTDFGPYYDSARGLIAGKAFLDSEGRLLNVSDPGGYKLQDMCEGTMAVLWAVLNGQVPEDAWENLQMHVIPYTTADGEVIDVLQGHVASFHEYWILGFLPVMEDSEWAALMRNYLRVQAENARRLGMPGFSTAAYTYKGYDTQIGPHSIARHRKGPENVAVTYGTAMAMLIDGEVGARWLHNLFDYPGMLTPEYGALESVAPEGYAKVMTTDDHGLTILSASQAEEPWLINLIKRHMAKQRAKKYNPRDPSAPTESGQTMLERFRELMRTKLQKALTANGLSVVRTSTRPIPGPLLADQQFRVDIKPIEQGTRPLVVTRSLEGGHFHGANTRRIGTALDSKSDWELHPDADTAIAFAFDIKPGDPETTTQYAWIGTYVRSQDRVGMAEYNRAYVTIPVDTEPHVFNIEFKTEDTMLAGVRVDTEQKGTLSADGRFKTIAIDFRAPEAAGTNPFSYIAISVDDPSNLSGEYARYARRGQLRIKEIKLVKEDITQDGSVPDTRGEKEFLGLMAFQWGNMPFEQLGVGHFKFKAREFAWSGGPISGNLDVRGFDYMNLLVYNPSGRSFAFSLELKDSRDRLLHPTSPGTDPPKYKVEVPFGDGWHIVSVPLKPGINQLAKTFAISDAQDDFELGWGTFSKEPLAGRPPGATRVRPTTRREAAPTPETPAPKLRPTQPAPAPVLESIDEGALINMLTPAVESFDQAVRAADYDAANATLKGIQGSYLQQKSRMTSGADARAQAVLRFMEGQFARMPKPEPVRPTVRPVPITPPVRVTPTARAGQPVVAMSGKSILRNWFPNNGQGSGMEAEEKEGVLTIDGIGWRGDIVVPPEDISQHKYVNIVVRTTSGSEESFYLQLKEGARYLLNQHVRVPVGVAYTVLQFKVPARGQLNYLAFNNATGEILIKDILLTNTPLIDRRGALPEPMLAPTAPVFPIPMYNQWLYSLYREHALSGDLAKVRDTVLRGKYVSPRKRHSFAQEVRDDLLALLVSNFNLRDQDIESLRRTKDLTDTEAANLRDGRIRVLASTSPSRATPYNSLIDGLVASGAITEDQKRKVHSLRTALLREEAHRLMEEEQAVQEVMGEAEKALEDHITREMISEDMQVTAAQMAAIATEPVTKGSLHTSAVVRGAVILATTLGAALGSSPAMGNPQQTSLRGPVGVSTTALDAKRIPMIPRSLNGVMGEEMRVSSSTLDNAL